MAYHLKRPAPHDFCAVAPTMSRRDLCRHYSASNRTVIRWFQETDAPGRPSQPAHNRRPVPDDFAVMAPTMTENALSHHYGCMRETVTRWANETGISCMAFDREANMRRMNIKRHMVKKLPHGHFIPHRTTSMFDDAANVLRRERFPVYRCTEKGAADQKGDFWRVGWTVLTPDALLIRAAKYEAKAA